MHQFSGLPVRLLGCSWSVPSRSRRRCWRWLKPATRAAAAAPDRPRTRALQLKLRRAGAAEVPANCGGVYSVSGPGVNINNKELPAEGRINFQGTIGQTYSVSVQLTCGVAQVTRQGLAETLSGTAQITLQPGTRRGRRSRSRSARSWV